MGLAGFGSAALAVLAGVAVLFPGAADGVFSDPTLFPLVEASGSASGHLIAVGRFCGRQPSEPWLAPTEAALASPEGAGGLAVVVNTTSGDVSLMAGPTPHVIHSTLQAQPFAVGATVLAADDLDRDGGDELIFAGPQGVSVVKFEYTAGRCTAGAIKQLAADPSLTDIVSLTSMPLKPTGGGAQLIGVTQAASNPFVLLQYAAGSLRVAKRTDFGIPTRSGWEWSSVAAGGVTWREQGKEFGHDGIAALTRVSQGSSAAEVLLLGADLAPTGANTTVTLASDLLTTQVADVFGDGAPGVLLIERKGAMLHYLWPGAANQVTGLGHELLAPPGGAVALDSGREWVAAAAAPFLAGEHVLEREEQIFGLRAPDDMHDFSVSVVIHGRPEHWTRRRASLANLRGTQEFKATYNDSARNVAGLTAPADVEKIKTILASTRTNTFLWSVCDCTADWRVPTAWGCGPLDKYDDFVRFLDGTRDFKVEGEQLRVWLGLDPPSEAHEEGRTLETGDCRPPTDSPLTPWNETEIFAGADEPYTA